MNVKVQSRKKICHFHTSIHDFVCIIRKIKLIFSICITEHHGFKGNCLNDEVICVAIEEHVEWIGQLVIGRKVSIVNFFYQTIFSSSGLFRGQNSFFGDFHLSWVFFLFFIPFVMSQYKMTKFLVSAQTKMCARPKYKMAASNNE